MNKTVVVTVNTAWNLIDFREGLVRVLIRAGYDVVALTPEDRHVERVKELECRFVHVPMHNQGTNRLQDLALLRKNVRLLRKFRPAAVLGFTIKLNRPGFTGDSIS